MSLAKITLVRGRAVPVPGDDVDTDRIIPARFLKCVTFDGLGAYAFHDVRFDTDGRPTGHPLDDPRYRGASILVTGRNFGCGSSREHAPQSLYYAGFRAVVAESFAEIFFGNATTLGIPCVALERSDREALSRSIAERPAEEMEIDVAGATIRFAGREFAGRMPQSTRRVLVEGQWDPLAQLLEGRDAVARVTKRIPPPPRAA
jgi:3-isopropylmalate/(R)-2-methylmalate dehydratase small subunit